MTLLVKDANTTIQSLSTEPDGSGNLVPVHAPASVAQGVASPVGADRPGGRQPDGQSTSARRRSP